MNQRMKQMGKKQFFHYSKCRADWLKKRKKNMQEQNGDAALGTMEALKNAFSNEAGNDTAQDGNPVFAHDGTEASDVGHITNS